MLSIHSRTAKEKSQVPANWELIGQVRQMRDEISPATLIVGNGDVMNRHQGLGLAKKHKLDGIMIGRGVFNDPFAFGQQSPWAGYSRQQKIELYRKHIKLFSKTWQKRERRIETLNKFCKVYISDFEGAKEMRERLMNQQSTAELLAVLDSS